MRRSKPSCPGWLKPLLIAFLLMLGGVNAQAQGFLSQGASSVGQFFSQDLPGALDSAMPLLFPPYFGGEIHIRPYFYGLASGLVEVPDKGTINLEYSDSSQLSKSGIGLSSKGSYVEFMARLQFSRLSLRLYANKDIRRIPADHGRIGWIDYSAGLDFDIINSYGIIFGINGDVWAAPSLTYNAKSGLAYALGDNLTGGGKITGYAPITYGIHASYNPFNTWIISPTIEFRYNWPYSYQREKPSAAGNFSQLTQWEYAVGLKLPKTVIGSSGLRFGYRDSALEFAGGAGSSDRSSLVTLQYSGYFGELVWFY